MHSDNYTVPFILAILNLPYTTPLPQVFHWFLCFFLEFHYFMFLILKIKFKSINANANNFTIQLVKQDK